MSHFSVAVFTKHGTEEEVAFLMFPYREDIEYLPYSMLEFEEDKYGDFDEETGKHGFWQNPNAKWDWYSIGYRWSHALILKNGEKADSAKVEDIDFQAMKIRDIKKLEPFSDCYEREVFNPEYFNRIYPNEDAYIHLNTTFNTYAVLLPDRTWITPGKAHWSENPEELNEFIDTYYERFIKPAIEDGLYITIVDCHI